MHAHVCTCTYITRTCTGMYTHVQVIVLDATALVSSRACFDELLAFPEDVRHELRLLYKRLP